MGSKFEFFIDGANKDKWEEADWSELVDRFAISYTDSEGLHYPPYPVAWPMDSDPAYERLERCYAKAVSDMRKAGAPHATPEMVIVRFPVGTTLETRFRAAFARFFSDKLQVLLINANFAEEAEDDDEIMGVLMHELLHAGLHGTDDPVLRNGHGTLWYRWADILERKHGYDIIKSN